MNRNIFILFIIKTKIKIIRIFLLLLTMSEINNTL